jgi:competence protein ComEA
MFRVIGNLSFLPPFGFRLQSQIKNFFFTNHFKEHILYLMDESLLERVRLLWFPILLGVGGLAFLGYGMYTLHEKPKEDILFNAAKDDTVSERKAQSNKQITIDIEGGVMKPGVYHLKGDSLLQDGLIAAGGLSAHADRQAVAKNLNMASKLIDGAKIYIPLEGESGSETSTTGSSSTNTGMQGSQININSASSKELDSLPGVGTVTSDKIIAGRPYATIDELLQKKIVGQKVFDQIKEKIVAQ